MEKVITDVTAAIKDNMYITSAAIPCEIIEASMLSNKNINDISDKLIELTWQINDDKDLVNKQLLHTICERYYLKSITNSILYQSVLN